LVETSNLAPQAASPAASTEDRRAVHESATAAFVGEIAALPEQDARALLATLDLSGADLEGYGSALIVRLPDGQVLVVRDYFSGPDLSLPPDLQGTGAQVTVVDSADFAAYVGDIETIGGDSADDDPDDDNLENFETAAGGDGEVDPALAALLAADPELAALFAAVGLDGMLAAVGVDPTGGQNDQISSALDLVNPPQFLFGSAGPNPLSGFGGPILPDNFSPLIPPPFVPVPTLDDDRTDDPTDNADTPDDEERVDVPDELLGDLDNPDAFGGGAGAGFDFADVDGPLGALDLSASEPSPDFAAGLFVSPNADTQHIQVDSKLVTSFAELFAIAFARTLIFQGDSGNDFDWSGDGIDDEDFVEFTDPHNFYHEFLDDRFSATYSTDPNLRPDFELRFMIDGLPLDDDFQFPDPRNTFGTHFMPDVRQMTPLNIIQNTNLERFHYEGRGQGLRDYALPGAGNPDMLSFHAGDRDFDTVAFYDKNDPFGGNGDYDLVTPFTFLNPNDPSTEADNTFEQILPYSRLTGIDAIDAIGYGTNTIVFNDTALNAISDTRMLNGAPVRRFDIGGGAGDTLVFTDEQNWTYNGIVEEAARDFNFPDGTGGQVTVTLGGTLDRLENVAYQIAHNSGDSFVNFSATIGDHPDWYWFGGTNGDDVYELPDTQFGNVDFMGGRDTLELTGRTWSNGVYDFDGVFDFTGVGGLFNVEVLSTIDGAAGGADTVILDKAAVNAITDANNELIVTGDAADGVNLTDVATDWNWVGKVDGEDDFVGQQFHQFQAFDGSAVLSIFDGLAGIPDLRMFGDAGDAMTFSNNGDWMYAGYVEAAGIWPSLNVFTGTASGGENVTLIVDDNLGVARVNAAATAGDDRFFARDSDIANFDGGLGLDALILGMGGAEDLTTGSIINAIEVFNANNDAANALTIDADLAINAQNCTIYVVGDATDTLAFAPGDVWTQDGNVTIGATVLESYSATASDGGAVTALIEAHLT